MSPFSPPPPLPPVNPTHAIPLAGNPNRDCKLRFVAVTIVVLPTETVSVPLVPPVYVMVTVCTAPSASVNVPRLELVTARDEYVEEWLALLVFVPLLMMAM